MGKKPAEAAPSPAVAAIPIEAAAAPAPMVRYRGSILRPDGGWDVIDITVPAAATSAEITQAIANWRQLRDESLAHLRSANRRWSEQTSIANPALILTFGKYAGRALAEVVQLDRPYVEWLANEGRDEEVKISARYLINLADAIARTAAIAGVSGAIEEQAAGAVFDEPPPF